MILKAYFKEIHNFILIPLYVAFYTATVVFLSLPTWSLWSHTLATGLFMLYVFIPIIPLVMVGSLLSRLNKRFLRYSIWISLGLFGGYLLADEMNTLVRLRGEYASLAWIALICQLGLGIGVGLLCATLQSYQDQNDIEQQQWGGITITPIKRWLIALCMIMLAVACHILDFLYLVDLYPTFHHTMRLVFIIIIVWVCIFTQITHRIPYWISARSPIFIGYAVMVMLLSCMMNVDDDDTAILLQKRKLFDYSISQLRMYTDWDRDYHSSWFAGRDCAPWNSKIYPGAKEIPNNNIDDNCHAGDLKTPLSKPIEIDATPLSSTTKTASSIVLITIDTLRADHMSVYGYKRKTTPNLKKWSQTASIFTRAYSASAWTSLAISSLMTGLYPSKIQWTQMFETTKFRLLHPHQEDELKSGEKFKIRFTLALKDKHQRLAEILQKAGMYTIGVVDDGYGDFLGEKVEMNRGFDHFQTMDRFPRKFKNDATTIKVAMEQLKKRPKDQPFFLWVHLFGPHDPNSKHKSSPHFGNHIKDKYDHEIHFMDLYLGKLLHKLDSLQKKEEVTVVVTSDHGEIFKGTKRYHGANLKEDLIRVPLMIKGKGWPHGTFKQVASLVDIVPTILKEIHQDFPHSMDGLDLKSLILAPKVTKRILFAETWFIKRSGKILRDYISAFNGYFKVVYDRNRHSFKTYRQKKEKLVKKPNKYKSAIKLKKALNYYIEVNSNDRGAVIQ